jgi:phenylalanyl-tRNA synthetase alpha subunit
MTNSIQRMPPNMTIRVVYHSKDGTWRGFCAPFDISCTAETAKQAMKKIDELHEMYMDGLKKYGYPTHLVSGKNELSDKEDEAIFEVVLKHIAAEVSKKIQSDFANFVKAGQSTPFSFKSNHVSVQGTYAFSA